MESNVIRAKREGIPEGFKRCSSCKEVKQTSHFRPYKKSKDGFRYECIQCRSAYYRKNEKDIREKSKKYYEDNTVQALETCKAYRTGKESKVKEYNQNYYDLNSKGIKDGVKRYRRERARNDINFRLMCRYRTRVYRALKGTYKPKGTAELIGCSIDNLKIHLERKFTEGMTWENYGEWHVDHIKPCASFNFANEHEQLECFHYTNLQPLWAHDNLEKSARII